MRTAALALVLIVSACCKKCPPIPPAPPPKVVKIRARCMDPLPELIVPVIPDPPEGANKVEIGAEEFRQLFMVLATLRSYLEVQLERCRVP